MLGLASATSWLCTFATQSWSSTGKFTKSSGRRGTSGCVLKCSIIRSSISRFAIKIYLAIAAILSRAVGGTLLLSFGVRTGSDSGSPIGSPFS